MKIIHSIKEMSEIAKRQKYKGRRIGFVPTMGALHAGHLSLIQKARKENDFVVVSIFVNPAQFGPKEDFKKYPRDLKKDALLCRKVGVDIIFNPEAGEMYPPDYKTYILVKDLSDCLCGHSRPGHFTGVATVVTKLFNIVQPNTAYFGGKDAQQAVIIKKMVSDLNMPLKIKVLPIIRERDGLALSSRNIYLDKKERLDAQVLFKALNLAKLLIKNGLRDKKAIINKVSRLLKKKKTARIDYVSLVGPDTLEPIEKIKGPCLVALAVYFGRTRLIDNMLCEI